MGGGDGKMSEKVAALEREKLDADNKHKLSVAQLTHEKEMATMNNERELQMQQMQLAALAKEKDAELAMARQSMELQQQFDERQRSYEREHAKEMEQLKQAAQRMEAELKNAEEHFIEEAGDPDQYDKVQDTIFQTFLSKVEQMAEVQKMEKTSMAVLGQNGVGKSSLINAMAGKKVTEVGVVDCTKEVSKVFGSDTADFYDVPGCNESRSYCNLKHIMKIKTMHLILICYVDRVEHIIKLEQMVASCKVPYIVVRTKMDQVAEDEDRQKMWSTEKELIKGNLCYVSSQSGEGMDHLKATAKQLAGVEL